MRREEPLNRYKVVSKYDGTGEEEEDEKAKKKGWRKIAVLKNPAVNILGMAFASEDEGLKMAFADDAKMRIAAPLSVPMVIKRKAIQAEEGETSFNDGQPFEAEFTREEIEKQFLEFMSDPRNLIDVYNKDHNEGEVVPAYLLEIWMVEKPKVDKSYTSFGCEVPAGTVFVVTQYTDRAYYDKVVQEGAFGLSLEGRFGLELQLSDESETPKRYADVLIINSENEVQMLHRKESDDFEPNVWGFPGGKIEEGEEPIEGAIREAFEETGWELSDLQPLEEIENEDGSTTYYFTTYRKDTTPCYPSQEHDESCYYSVEELEELPVIMRQNDRFRHLTKKALEIFKKESMKEGQEFEINGVMYVVKDGKPQPKEAEAEVEAAKEEGKEGEEKTEEKEIEAAAEPATPAPAGGLTKEEVKAMIEETVAPMITEAMKAVVASLTEANAEEEKSAKEAEMKYAEEQAGKTSGFAGAVNFLKGQSK
jgi:8-oxo-dGTP diphosphatase